MGEHVEFVVKAHELLSDKGRKDPQRNTSNTFASLSYTFSLMDFLGEPSGVKPSLIRASGGEGSISRRAGLLLRQTAAGKIALQDRCQE